MGALSHERSALVKVAAVVGATTGGTRAVHPATRNVVSRGMLSWLGLNRSFVTNPVTLGVLALVMISGAAATRTHLHLTETCAAASPVVVNATGMDGYYVGRYERIAYETCGRNRIPETYVNAWPLSDCRPGGRAMWSNGSLAGFPQVCRHNRGNVSVL